jgi:hypothetical protein
VPGLWRGNSLKEFYLRSAIAGAGGEVALSKARVLAWTGEASVYVGDRRIDLNVETLVEPFTYARSDTWLRGQGRSTLRTLEIDGDEGWLVRDGARTPMPAAMLTHERQQYAIYGLMRLVTLRDPGARFSPLPVMPEGRTGLRVRHPRAVPTDLFFSNGKLVAATNRVDAPDGGAPIDQRFEFSGEIVGAGVRWPRSLRLFQSGQPYFSLDLATFAPRLSR